MWQKGFKNVHLLDWSARALQNFQEQLPDFPDSQLINSDFFEHEKTAESDKYDLIVEQTFFCAIDPSLRPKYVQKMSDLLKNEGKLVGLLFNIPLNLGVGNEPPFGGNQGLYQSLFEPSFRIKAMDTCSNSVRPRAGNELFVIFVKK